LEPDRLFESGFNLHLCSVEDKDKLSQNLSDSVDEFIFAFEALSKRNIQSQIDIGVTVGGVDQYTCTIALSPNIINTLAKLKVEVAFSAYPEE
jgi:hypothetical protein